MSNDLQSILTALCVGGDLPALPPHHRKSSLQTWQQCPVRHTLEYRIGLKAPSGEAADLGTRAHSWLEGMTGTPGDPDHVEIPADLEELRDGLLWAATLAFNLTGGAYRGDVRAEWSFGKGDDEPLWLHDDATGLTPSFAGTADLVWADEEGMINVLDYKTGWGHLPPCEESLELALYALGAAAALEDPVHYGGVRVHYAILRTREHRSAVLSWSDLRVWAQRIAALAVRVDSEPAERAAPNRYCASCPASAVCPALHRGEGDPVEMLEAARAALKLAERRVKAAEAAAMTAARTGDPRLRVVTPTRRAYDAQAVWKGLDFGADVGALAALVYPRISATGARALRKAGVSQAELDAAAVEVPGEEKVEVVADGG